MKKLLFTAALLSTLITGMAQEPVCQKGDNIINATIGLGSTYSYGTTTIPPISVSYEKIMWDSILDKGYIGVGGYLGLSASKDDYSWGIYKYTYTIFGARGNFHYQFIDKLDTYTGLFLGYVFAKSSYEAKYSDYDWQSTAGSSGLGYAWYIGARYYFNDRFSALAELGYGISYLNIGVAYKF